MLEVLLFLCQYELLFKTNTLILLVPSLLAYNFLKFLLPARLFVGETDPRTPMGPADWAPFGSAGGGDRTKSRSRRGTRAVYPASELSGEITLLLLLVWLYYVLARES